MLDRVKPIAGRSVIWTDKTHCVFAKLGTGTNEGEGEAEEIADLENEIYASVTFVVNICVTK